MYQRYERPKNIDNIGWKFQENNHTKQIHLNNKYPRNEYISNENSLFNPRNFDEHLRNERYLDAISIRRHNSKINCNKELRTNNQNTLCNNVRSDNKGCNSNRFLNVQDYDDSKMSTQNNLELNNYHDNYGFQREPAPIEPQLNMGINQNEKCTESDIRTHKNINKSTDELRQEIYEEIDSLSKEEIGFRLELIPSLRRPLWERKLYRQLLHQRIPDEKTNTLFNFRSNKDVNTWSLNEFFRSIQRINPFHRLKKKIEGKEGASVVAVFNLIEDLLWLNLFIMVLMIGCVVIPTSVDTDPNSDQDLMTGWRLAEDSHIDCSSVLLEVSNSSEVYNASVQYRNKIEKDKGDKSIFQELFEGSGVLERSWLFSGFYPIVASKTSFQVGLSFIIVILVVFLVSLLFVASKFHQWCLELGTHKYDGLSYSKILFTFWDFQIRGRRPVDIEKSVIAAEFNSVINEDRWLEKQKSLTVQGKRILFLKRVLINLIIIMIIGGSWVGVYFTIQATLHNGSTNIINEYASTILISALNFILPFVFQYIGFYEYFSGRNTLLLLLSRCVFVRFTSLVVLIITELTAINLDDYDQCWESKIGQQMYKIIIFDMISRLFVCFIVNPLRKYLTRYESLRKFVAVEFGVTAHVLSVLYIQTVLWLGIVFSPLMPVVVFIFVILQYLFNFFTIFVTSSSTNIIFRSTKSSSMFTLLLVVSIAISLIPGGLYIGYLTPSKTCTPFRGLESPWQAIVFYICDIKIENKWLRDILFYLDNGIILVVVFVFLFLLIVRYASEIEKQNSKIKGVKKKLSHIESDKHMLKMKYSNMVKGRY